MTDLHLLRKSLQGNLLIPEAVSEAPLYLLAAKPELMDDFTKKFVEQYGEQIMSQLAKILIGA